MRMPLLLTKRATFHAQQPPKQQTPGIFSTSRTVLEWKPNTPGAADAVTADIASVSGQLQRAKNKPLLRIPLRSSFLVLEFDNIEDRDAVVDALTPLVQEVNSKGKQPAESDQFSGPPALVALKKQLLSDDRDLNALFKELVQQSGSISEQEFWAGRQHLLRRQQGGSGAQKQRTGVANAMVVGRPSADGKTNKVHYQLTPEGVQQIFAEKPHVQRAFVANVPAVMSEKTFWQRFFTNEFTRQALRQKAEAGDKAAALELQEGDELFKQHMDLTEVQRQNKAKMRRVDPTVNLAADGNDRWSESMNARNSSKDLGLGMGSSGGVRQDGIIQDINRHAAVVMEGLPGSDGQQQTAQDVAEAVRLARQAANEADVGQTQGNDAAVSDDVRAEWQTRAGSALDDLRADKTECFDALNIMDPRRYFEQAVDPDAGPVNSSRVMEDQAASVLEVLQSINPHALQSGMTTAAARQVLQDLHSEHTTVALDEQGSLVGIAPATDLAKPLQEECRRVALTCNELLRHFWACLPITTQPRQDKAARLDRALQAQYDRILAMQQGAEGTERYCIKQLLKPIDNALNASFERYHEERRNRGLQEHNALVH